MCVRSKDEQKQLARTSLISNPDLPRPASNRVRSGFEITNSVYEMVVVFIILDCMDICFDEYNHPDSLQAFLTERMAFAR